MKFATMFLFKEVAATNKHAFFQPYLPYLEDGSRVTDAIEAAGGFVVEADKNALNLAVDEIAVYGD